MRQLPGSVGLLPVPEVVNPMHRPEFGGRDRQPEVEALSVDAEELRSYRFAVARAAGHYKRYPEVAKQRGWEGVVTVAVSLSPTGPQPTVSLARSSGYDVLDRQALEMLDVALRQVMLPPSLQGRAYVFSVPVRYALGE